jgi:hypothetical protein
MALPEMVTGLHVGQSGQSEVLWFNIAVQGGAGHCRVTATSKSRLTLQHHMTAKQASASYEGRFQRIDIYLLVLMIRLSAYTYVVT